MRTWSTARRWCASTRPRTRRCQQTSSRWPCGASLRRRRPPRASNGLRRSRIFAACCLGSTSCLPRPDSWWRPCAPCAPAHPSRMRRSPRRWKTLSRPSPTSNRSPAGQLWTRSSSLVRQWKRCGGTCTTWSLAAQVWPPPSCRSYAGLSLTTAPPRTSLATSSVWPCCASGRLSNGPRSRSRRWAASSSASSPPGHSPSPAPARLSCSRGWRISVGADIPGSPISRESCAIDVSTSRCLRGPGQRRTRKPKRTSIGSPA